MEKNRSTKVVALFLICVALYTVLGFLVLPLIVKPILKDNLSQLLQREVSIEKIRTNPYSLSVTVRGLEIKSTEPTETLASWSELYVNFQTFSSLFHRALVIKELYLREPSLRIERDQSGDLNILSLFPKKTGNQETEGQEGELAIRVDLIELEGGNMFFSDRSRPESFETTIYPISLFLLNLDSSGQNESDFKFSAESEKGETVSLFGSFQLNPLRSHGTVEIRNLMAPKYAPYYGNTIAFAVEEGALTAKTEYRYEGGKESPAAELANLSLSLSDTLLRKETVDFLKVGAFTIDKAGINFNEKTIDIGMIATSDGAINVVRESNGTLNVSTLVPPADGVEKVEVQEKTESPWIITVQTLSSDGYTLTFEDRSTGEPAIVKLQNIEIAGENISTAEESRGSLRIDFQEEMGGSFSTEGTVGVNPLFVDLSLKLSDFNLTRLQPYVSEVADLIVQKGSISTEGSVTVEAEDEGPPSLTLQTDIEIADFSSLDSVKGEGFFNFASLNIDNLDIHHNPNTLAIGEVSLSDFYATITINPDQTLNTSEIFRGKQKEDEPLPEKDATRQNEEPFFERTGLERIVLAGGQINFTDRFITPNYRADLYEIEGKISGIFSDETSRATVDLRGKLDKTIPLKITGTTNPLKKDFFADLTIEFENIELGPMTPYSQKYLGYPIDKGKLFLNLAYKIDERKIESENKIFIDQFTLGEPIDSPDAIKLPVKLAISLLQNRKGEIDLNVPVSGSLDDPEFSVGYFIFKIITNIIEKAVTSPFALIGSLAGGGEELGYVEFDYGSAEISKGNAEKLDKLDEALYSRPLLNLEIEGHTDTENDRATLEKTLFDNKIKSAKLRDNARKGEPSIPLEDITISPEEYETYLAIAYRDEKLPEPKGEKALALMEKGLRGTITITDDDLRQLAYERSSVIRDYIIASGKIEKERIFLLEPKSLMPEKRENIKDSRVDFHLK